MSYALSLDQQLDVRQQMRQRVSARLVAASTMLELNGMALQQAIERELAENPALEADEVAACDVCGTPLHGSICPTCLRMQRAELPEEDTSWDRDVATQGADGDDFDPIVSSAGQETLAERLINALCTMLPRADRRIAEYLVGSLDERGFLGCSTEEIADSLGVELVRVDAALLVLQSLEPVGVGARDLRECLMIQIEHLEKQGIADPLVRRIVEEHWSDLAHRKTERIARALRVPSERVADALQFVRERLNPFPAQGHAGPETAVEARATYTWPDVAIVAVDDGFAVEVIEARRLEFRLSSAYADMARQAAALGDAERQHVQQYTSRARLFMQNVAQRRQTIKKVTEAIVKAQQREFLRQGVRHLVPLTRSQIATALAIDESTVSRATNGKHVMLPNGQVVSFDTFFAPALAVHEAMRSILAGEGRALTDGEIARELAEEGIHIARRTVAKYRGQIGVLPSSMRPQVHAA